MFTKRILKLIKKLKKKFKDKWMLFLELWSYSLEKDKQIEVLKCQNKEHISGIWPEWYKTLIK
jgi:hypothetical protein